MRSIVGANYSSFIQLSRSDPRAPRPPPKLTNSHILILGQRPGEAEAQTVAPDVGPAAVAERRPTVLGREVPATATYHPVRASGVVDPGTSVRRNTVEDFMILILDPILNISGHAFALIRTDILRIFGDRRDLSDLASSQLDFFLLNSFPQG